MLKVIPIRGFEWMQQSLGFIYAHQIPLIHVNVRRTNFATKLRFETVHFAMISRPIPKAVELKQCPCTSANAKNEAWRCNLLVWRGIRALLSLNAILIIGDTMKLAELFITQPVIFAGALRSMGLKQCHVVFQWGKQMINFANFSNHGRISLFYCSE